MKTSRKNHHQKPSAKFAVLLIIVGFVFLGLNLGFIPQPYKAFLFSWPMLLLVIGVMSLLKRHFWSGLILFSTGTFFLLPRILMIYPDFLPLQADGFVHTYWPVLLIFAGLISLVYMMFPHSMHCRCCGQFDDKCYQGNKKATDKVGSATEEYAEGYFNKQSVFSSGKYIVLDPIFKGGEINTVLGETILDLRKTSLSDGNTVLNLNTVLGGVTIYVPAHWVVDIKIESIMYSFKDGRIDREQPSDMTKRLTIEGAGVLGGGELRN